MTEKTKQKVENNESKPVSQNTLIGAVSAVAALSLLFTCGIGYALNSNLQNQNKSLVSEIESIKTSLNNDLNTLSNKNIELDSKVVAGLDNLDNNLSDLDEENQELKEENDKIKDSLSSVTQEIEAVSDDVKDKIQEQSDIHPDIISSIVKVYALDSSYTPFASGSGTIISPKGYILTNNHVIDGTHNDYVLVCITDDEDSAPVCNHYAKVIKSDSSRDLALLKFERWEDPSDKEIKIFKDTDRFTYREIVENYASDLKLNDTLFALGYPSSGLGSITFTKGIYSGPIDDLTYKTDTNIFFGSSGGFVFTPTSAFAGVSQGGDVEGDLGYIIKPEQVLEFVSKTGIKLYD